MYVIVRISNGRDLSLSRSVNNFTRKSPSLLLFLFLSFAKTMNESFDYGDDRNAIVVVVLVVLFVYVFIMSVVVVNNVDINVFLLFFSIFISSLSS